MTYEWMDQAVCASIPEFLDLDPYKAIEACRNCPVRFECLEFGISQEPANAASTVIYGGVLPSKLVKLTRARFRIRPDQRRIRDGIYEMACIRCGREFGADSPRAKYCGRTCQTAAYQQRRVADQIAAVCRSVGQA